MTKYIEDELQIACATWLACEERLHGDIIGYHVPNGGRRSKSEGARFKRMGVRAGVADLIIHTDMPTTVYVELKAKDGRLNANQKKFRDSVKHLGFDYHIIRTDYPIEAVGKLSTILKPYRTIFLESANG